MQANNTKYLYRVLKMGMPLILLGVNLTAIVWLIIRFLNLTFPFLGRDYMSDVPALLDSKLFYRLNGLAIQWYTPSFGGGIPAYPDPNNGQFSPLILMASLFPIWKAVTLSSAMFIAVGFLAGFYFFKKVLRLSWASSLLGTIFFSLNGFITQRIAVGHLGYESFTLLPLFLIILCDSSIPRELASLLFSLLITVLIYQAGYFVIIVFCLSTIVVLPIIYIYDAQIIRWKMMIQVMFFGGLLALLMSASKLSAIYSFMRFFPRKVTDTSSLDATSGLISIFYQLLGTMNLVPIFRAIGIDINQVPQFMQEASGSIYGFFWEFDMSLSPVIFGILIFGIISLILSPKKTFHKLTQDKKWIALFLLILSIWVTCEFILARGWIFPLFRGLPIISSLHVNMRFTSALLFPLALVVTLFYNKWSNHWSPKISLLALFALNILTILPFGSYFMLSAYTSLRDYNVTELLITDQLIDSGAPFRIKRIEDVVDNSRAMKRGVSNLLPYNPIFGYDLRYFHSELKVGSVWEESNGYYNMTNPTGFVFPEINNSHPFERIRVDDGENLKLFAMHLQPNWKIPFYQHFFDWLSGLSFISIMVVVLSYTLRWILKYVRALNTWLPQKFFTNWKTV